MRRVGWEELLERGKKSGLLMIGMGMGPITIHELCQFLFHYIYNRAI